MADDPVMSTAVTLDTAATEPSPPAGRMRTRLARLGSRPPSGDPALEPLFRVVRATHPKADLAIIQRAYEVAERCHRNQTRKSGDPYITHPLAVASILAELGMTPPTLCAALLHDTVEDTSYTIGRLREDFGDEVALLVDEQLDLLELARVERREREVLELPLDRVDAQAVRERREDLERLLRLLLLLLLGHRADRAHVVQPVG